MNKTITSLMSCLITLTSLNTYADCIQLIALSKTKSSVVQDRSAVENHASNFCKEYSSHTGSSSSGSFGASYKFLSAQMGNSNASESDVASMFCSASSFGSASSDAYRNYVEFISPNAYKAFEACERLEKAEIKFDLLVKHEMDVVASVAYKPHRYAPAKIEYAATGNSTTCSWNSSTDKMVTLTNKTMKAVLKCTKTDLKSDASVIITDVSSGSGDTLVIEWPSKDSQQATALKELEDSLKNSVVAFASNTCPQGWAEYKAAYGLFIRGLDKSGNSIDPSGLRKIGDPMQPDAVGPHTHTARLKLGAEPVVPQAGDARSPEAAGAHGRDSARWTSDSLILSNEGTESRPKNIALLYCRRQ